MNTEAERIQLSFISQILKVAKGGMIILFSTIFFCFGKYEILVKIHALYINIEQVYGYCF